MINTIPKILKAIVCFLLALYSAGISYMYIGFSFLFGDRGDIGDIGDIITIVLVCSLSAAFAIYMFYRTYITVKDIRTAAIDSTSIKNQPATRPSSAAITVVRSSALAIAAASGTLLFFCIKYLFTGKPITTKPVAAFFSIILMLLFVWGVGAAWEMYKKGKGMR